MAAVYACTEGAMFEPDAASCMSWYVAKALLVSPLRVHTSIKVVAILQSGWQPSRIASSQTCKDAHEHCKQLW